MTDRHELCRPVALLAEGVDRNRMMRLVVSPVWVSPSSRRAWIEICGFLLVHVREKVALLAEGVDRNSCRSSSMTPRS